MRARSLAAAIAIALQVCLPGAAIAAAPSAADVASAKQLFAQGLKLYQEGSYREALAAFLRANALSPRASIQRNVAQCHRDLKDFASAYDAYQVLLAKYGASMGPADKRSVQRAIDQLALLTGAVRVAIPDAGAAVTVDGHDAGTTPLTAPLRVNLGQHTLAVSKAGFETLTKDVKINGGDEVSIDGTLQPEVTTGHLVVSAPPDAKVEVFVDGADVGPAPWEGDLAPGTHAVEARGADRFSVSKPVDLAKHARVEVALDLVAHTGRVQIDSHTSDATILVDGRALASGVWDGPLPAGEHQLSIEASGYRPYRRVFVVHSGETYVEDARLETDTGSPRYEGVYSGFGLFGFATPSGASASPESCPGCSPSASSPLGAGLAVRVGYAFGWIAVEGMAFGSYDYATGNDAHAGATGDLARTESYDFHQFGGGGLLGIRVASKHPTLRFTASALGGVVEMGNIYTQSANPVAAGSPAQFTSSTTTYTAPALSFDAGVLVGWPAGAKVHVSALTMIQFVGNPVMAPAVGNTNLGNAGSYSTPPVQVAGGTQVFIGPLIGFDLGL